MLYQDGQIQLSCIAHVYNNSTFKYHISDLCFPAGVKVCPEVLIWSCWICLSVFWPANTSACITIPCTYLILSQCISDWQYIHRPGSEDEWARYVASIQQLLYHDGWAKGLHHDCKVYLYRHITHHTNTQLWWWGLTYGILLQPQHVFQGSMPLPVVINNFCGKHFATCTVNIM